MVKRRHSKTKRRSSGIVIGWYACLFLDLLGQKEELRRFEGRQLDLELSDDPDFLILVRKTYGRVRELHNNVTLAVRSFRNKIGTAWPTESVDYWKALTQYEIRIVPFSDGVLVAIPLMIRDRETLPTHGVGMLLAMAAILMLQQLASGSPIRGAIEIGHLAHVGNGVYYGPALANAYEAEKRKAQYPRVVVGNTVLEYMDNCKRMTPVDAGSIRHVSRPESYARLTRSLAEVCSQMLARDSNGTAYVHYLSNFILEDLQQGVGKEAAHAAYDFVKTEHSRLVLAGNDKLVARYESLIEYYDRHLSRTAGE